MTNEGIVLRKDRCLCPTVRDQAEINGIPEAHFRPIPHLVWRLERLSGEVPVTHGDAFFVISRSSLASGHNRVLTCFGRDSLERRWSAELPQGPEVSSRYRAEPLFHLDGDTLQMLAGTSLSFCDANSGRVLVRIPLP